MYGGLRTPVPADASPAFIAGVADDESQPNDPILIYSALRHAGVPAELHLYERGGHGFDLRPKEVTSDLWFSRFLKWMQMRGGYTNQKTRDIGSFLLLSDSARL
ncbi:alpha/beta hydrolase [Stenotrophomonas lactitubi]|uniref:alpha/beta hydrolase n=1 Tax=Stenotrophomonas lactitubi TaxID=2045214 RepID=UPI0033403BE5